MPLTNAEKGACDRRPQSSDLPAAEPNEAAVAPDCAWRARIFYPELSVRLSPVRLGVGDPADQEE
jgi:hypothetical protein